VISEKTLKKIIEHVWKHGWEDGYYNGGEHDCRMFEPSAKRHWKFSEKHMVAVAHKIMRMEAKDAH